MRMYTLDDMCRILALSEKKVKKNTKVLAPGHGFNSERSQRAENGGRP